MVSHYPAKFGDHKHCDSGDIMILVVKEQDSKCSGLNPPSIFISNAHDMKAHDMPY